MSGIDPDVIQTVPDFMVEAGLLDGPIDVTEHVVELTADRTVATMTAAVRSRRVPAKWVRGAIGVVVLFIVLEAVTRAELVTPDYLPPASSILRETFDLLTDPSFLGDVWVTLQACLIGLAIATVVAVPLGLVLGLTEVAYRATVVVIEFLRPIPSVALIPLAILIYGRGLEMKVSLVVFACVWPLLFNTIYGIHSVDPVAVDSARVLGLGRWQIGGRVYLRTRRRSSSPG